jgi:hypothetical protein
MCNGLRTVGSTAEPTFYCVVLLIVHSLLPLITTAASYYLLLARSVSSNMVAEKQFSKQSFAEDKEIIENCRVKEEKGKNDFLITILMNMLF